MAIVRMRPFCAVGMVDLRLSFLQGLQKLGCVEIENLKTDSSLNDSSVVDKENRRLGDLVAQTGRAIEILERFCGLKKGLFGLKKVEPIGSLQKIEADFEDLIAKVERINFCGKKIERNLAEISNLNSEKIGLEPYLNLDCCLKNFETKRTFCVVGSFPMRFNKQKIEALVGDGVYFEIIFESKFKTIVFFVVLKDDYSQLLKKVSKFGFSSLNLNCVNKTARQRFDECCRRIEALNFENSELKDEIKKNGCFAERFKLFFDYLNLKIDENRQFNRLCKTKNTFFLSGYLNPNCEDNFKKLAEKFGVYFKISEPDSSSPVDFKNVGVVEAVEDVTKTYAMPSSRDVDPNKWVAFFHYLFFGIMFSDAGYGIVMALFCSFFAFSKRFDRQGKNRFKMFFWCGISTTFWGLMFGSFFGDFVGIASKTFFNSGFSLSPVFIDAINEPLKLLSFSLFLGLFQIFVGVLLKFFVLLKHKNYSEAFFVQLDWVFVLMGAGMFFVVSMLGLKGILVLVGVVLVAVGFVMLVFLSGYKKHGIMKLVGGFLNLYGVTSFVGDVLSYCRLMALAIATGVVASVVNLLSTMLCFNVFGFVLFALVFVFGHAMNFAVNALGAYVHTVRLQYVEFFSKFYEGGGRLFLPFKMNTKYFEFVFSDGDSLDFD